MVIPEGRFTADYNSNVLQLPGSGSDTIGKFIGGAACSYETYFNELGQGSSTQLISQFQSQIWRYAENPLFNVALNIATFQVAEKFEVIGLKILDSITPFAGTQIVYKVPMTQGISRVDVNVLAGFNAVKVFGSDKILAGGYQFSNLLAEVPQTAYSAHTLNMLFRMGIVPEHVTLSANYQLQLRLPQFSGVAKNLRNTVGLGFHFSPVSGFLITLGGDYTYQYAGPLPARIEYYSFNISIGTDVFLSLP